MNPTHKVIWAGGEQFVGSTASGHSLVIDGHRQVAASPMELMLLSAASCACIDVVMILQKARQKIVDVWVEISGQRREEMPKYYTAVHMHFVVKGTGVGKTHVERAIQLAMDKYCSASAQVAALAKITTDYEIVEADSR